MKTKIKLTFQPATVFSALALTFGLACTPNQNSQAQPTNAPPVPAAAPSVAPSGSMRYESVGGQCSCLIEGTATGGHGWEMKSAQISGSLETDAGFPESALARPDAAKPAVRIRIPMRTMKSNSDTMDKKMQSCMDVVKYPNIEYRLIELKPESPPGTKGAIKFNAVGSLTIYGKTLTNAMPVTIERKEGTLRVTGNTLVKLTDYAIPPCTFTIMTVHDDIKIKFDWLTAPKAKPQ